MIAPVGPTKPEAGVIAPEWYVRQSQASPLFRGPRDGVPPPRQDVKLTRRN